MTPDPEPAPPVEKRGLSFVLDALRPDPEARAISLETILTRIGMRSFPALLLVVAVLVVSPLSAIPFLPLVGSLMVLVIGLQAILRRQSLWLPKRLMQQTLKAEAADKAIAWLRKPVTWVDARRSTFLSILARGPFRDLAYLVSIGVAITWAPLSFIPMSATITAVGVVFIAAGLVLLDGLFIMIGYAWTAVMFGAVTLVLAGIL